MQSGKPCRFCILLSAAVVLGLEASVMAGSLQVIAGTAGVDWGTAGLSPDGQTVYGSFYPTPGARLEGSAITNGLFEWRATSGVETLPLAMPNPSFSYGAVRGSTYNGSELVGQAFDGWVNTTFGKGIATGSVKWTSSGISQILPVGSSSSPSGVVSRATAVSDDGSVVVGYSDPDNSEAQSATAQLGTPGAERYEGGLQLGFGFNNGYSQGFMQTSTSTVVLKDFGLVNDGTNVSRATAVSPDGKYAYGIARDGSGLYAITRWDSSGNPTALTGGIGLGAGTLGVQAASRDGNTLIGCDNFGGLFIWTAGGGYQDNSALEVSSDDPISMNGAGTFAVGDLGNNSIDGATLTDGPAVFIGGTSVGEPLATYLNAHGVSFPGFTLDTVDGMSRNGEFLSGTGHYTAGSAEYAWIADLNVPEPGSVMLLGICLPVLLRRRR